MQTKIKPATLKPAIKGFVVGRRRKRPDMTTGGIALPDTYLTGQDGITNTEYRLVEVLSVPSDLKKTVKVSGFILAHELDCVPFALSAEEYELQSIPWSQVYAYGKTVETLKPLRDVVFIKEDEQKEEVTSGGLILPSFARGIDKFGTVMKQTGPEVKELKGGDRVFWLKGYGLNFSSGESKFLAISEKDIVATVGE
jgi:co-chaperonin GroES (HSP10)